MTPQLPSSPPEPAPFAIVSGFLGPEECRTLTTFMEEMYNSEALTRNVFQIQTWTGRIDSTNWRPWPDDPRWQLCVQIREQIIQRVGIRQPIPDPLYGDFLSFMIPGGAVRPHRDDWKMEIFGADLEDPCQVRCNVFVQKDPGSGDPLLLVDDSERLSAVGPVCSGDMLVFSPSLTIHAASRVRDRPRILATFAFLMPKSEFAEVLRRAAVCPVPLA